MKGVLKGRLKDTINDISTSKGYNMQLVSRWCAFLDNYELTPDGVVFGVVGGGVVRNNGVPRKRHRSDVETRVQSPPFLLHNAHCAAVIIALSDTPTTISGQGRWGCSTIGNYKEQ